MAAAKKRIQVQVDKSLADEGDAVLNELGLTPTTAITMFYNWLSVLLNNDLPDEEVLAMLDESRAFTERKK